MLRRGISMLAAVALVALASSAAVAQQNANFAGAWKGAWESGGDGGRFELTLQAGEDGALRGGVSVGQPMGDYEAKFSSVKIADGELTARYSYTPDAQADIILTGKLQDGKLSGAWTMVAAGQDASAAFAAGTWKVSQ